MMEGLCTVIRTLHPHQINNYVESYLNHQLMKAQNVLQNDPSNSKEIELILRQLTVGLNEGFNNR